MNTEKKYEVDERILELERERERLECMRNKLVSDMQAEVREMQKEYEADEWEELIAGLPYLNELVA